MASTISPIDESSFSDAPAYDPEVILNNHTTRTEQTSPNEPARTSQDTVHTSGPVASEQASATISMENNTDTTIPESEAQLPHRSALSRFVNLLLDSRSVRFTGLVIVIVAVYAMIVSVSFFAHIGTDQSAVISGEFDPDMIENTGGPFGAWLSNILINEWLGIGTFPLIIWLILSGLTLMKCCKVDFWGLTVRCLLSSVALSVICGFMTSGISTPFYWGGRHGYILNDRLVTLTGFWGALGVSIIMAGMVVFLYLTELTKFFNVILSHTSVFLEKNRVAREERKRRKEEEELRRAESVAAMTTVPEVEKPSTSTPTPIVPMTLTETNTADDIATEPVFTESESSAKILESEDETEEKTDTVEENISDDELSLFNINPEEEKATVSEDLDTPLFPTSSEEKTSQIIAAAGQQKYDPRADLSGYKFPSLELLRQSLQKGPSVDSSEMEENKLRITNTLNNYGIPIRRIEATVGPTVTLYEIIPAEGVRIARIKHLEDDIALSLSALGIRIIAPIPGKGTIGIEVPNKDPQTVSMRSVIESDTYKNSRMELPMAMGCTISNEVFMADLCKMPHLLVAGATGMGKSVGLNAIIASLLYKKHPSELKFVLIDPKMVEFSLYAKLERHYLAKLPDEDEAIITDPSKVVATLNSLCIEMDNRYALLKDASMRNIKEYNERFSNHLLNPDKGHRYLPYIVVIVDEFADLIMTAGKEVETPIARIAQKARAVGIHMILATQRPSTNVITGIIKANFPGRIAFRVFQMVDSRTILDRPGANQLIGRGDMLFSNNGKIERVQCAFIDTPEVNAICQAIDEQVGYDHAYELPEYVPENDTTGSLASIGDRDPLFDECARLVVTTDTASTSSLQRRYSIGYNRAGKIMDQMEAAGIVGPSQGGKPRQVLVDPMMLERILENN